MSLSLLSLQIFHLAFKQVNVTDSNMNVQSRLQVLMVQSFKDVTSTASETALPKGLLPRPETCLASPSQHKWSLLRHQVHDCGHLTCTDTIMYLMLQETWASPVLFAYTFSAFQKQMSCDLYYMYYRLITSRNYIMYCFTSHNSFVSGLTRTFSASTVAKVQGRGIPKNDGWHSKFCNIMFVG